MEFILGTTASPVEVIAIGLVVGFLSGLIGVGGGFLMVPSLVILLKVPIRMAIGTDLLQMVGTASSGAFQHYRQKTADPILAVFLLSGSLLGAQCGALSSNYVSASILKLFFGVILVGEAIRLLLGKKMKCMERQPLKILRKELEVIRREEALVVKKVFGEGDHMTITEKMHEIEHGLFQHLPPFRIERKFHGEFYVIDIPKTIGIGFLVGYLAGLLGVGGGFLMVPLLIGVLKIPIHVAIGTDLVQITGTAASGAIAHWMLGHVIPMLSLLLLVGGVIGAQIGARLSKKLPRITLKEILGILLFIVGLKMTGILPF